ncbi:MAG TPA: non-canonical purine NTP pyrophosphatase [Pyrinomonadaceae bacterium]|nr:non-canonical purine NTP pyrophosphatase [Pyrinomonadaceae bacterium]
MRIYFVTMNELKFAEAEAFVKAFAAESGAEVSVRHVRLDLPEMMTVDMEELVRRKAVAAYRSFGLPCVVEHSGLFMKALRNLPGVLGKMIWDSVGERMSSFLLQGDERDAVARSVLGYCDGRRINIYRGETPGHIADRPRGDYDFCWDPIFIPHGGDQTYGELGPEAKLATSPAAQAWKLFLDDAVLGRRAP